MIWGLQACEREIYTMLLSGYHALYPKLFETSQGKAQGQSRAPVPSKDRDGPLLWAVPAKDGRIQVLQGKKGDRAEGLPQLDRAVMMLKLHWCVPGVSVAMLRGCLGERQQAE